MLEILHKELKTTAATKRILGEEARELRRKIATTTEVRDSRNYLEKPLAKDQPKTKNQNTTATEKLEINDPNHRPKNADLIKQIEKLINNRKTAMFDEVKAIYSWNKLHIQVPVGKTQSSTEASKSDQKLNTPQPIMQAPPL